MQEPSDILLAAFAQVQSLTETLNDYINVPQFNLPADALKSPSLCDDCTQTAGKQCEEQQQPSKDTQPQSSTGNSNISNNSQSTSTVINNEKLSESTTFIGNDILPDDDGYCEIDEIRLPSIPAKSSPPPLPPSASSLSINRVRDDPRRQSAAAPLPPTPNDNDESISISSTRTESLNGSTATLNHGNGSDSTKDNSSCSQENASNNVNEQTSIASSNSTSSANTVISNKVAAAATADADAEQHNHVTYDALSQTLAELNLNRQQSAKASKLNNGAAAKLRSTLDSLCPPPLLADDVVTAIPSVPCHLISAYVASLSLHISQLLVSILFLDSLYNQNFQLIQEKEKKHFLT